MFLFVTPTRTGGETEALEHGHVQVLPAGLPAAGPVRGASAGAAQAGGRGGAAPQAQAARGRRRLAPHLLQGRARPGPPPRGREHIRAVHGRRRGLRARRRPHARRPHEEGIT